MSSTITVAGISVPSGLYIGGKWVRGHGEQLSTENPATEEELAVIQTASNEDVDAAVAAARDCFENRWGLEISGTERGALINKLADAVDQNVDELAMLESLDAGKPIAWCKADIGDLTACLRYYAGAADKIHGTIIECDDKSKYALARKEPIGVCAQICPWNYPLVMLGWKIGPALAAGCSIVFKPAETTTLSTLKFASIFDSVGFPDGTFNLVNGLGTTVGKALSSHMDIDKIAFTGSTATGRAIAISAAQSNLKKVTLELGGKSANVVFESANLEEAAKWAAFGVFENAGQSCTAGSRILVQESVYDKFVPLFVAATNAPQVGDPLDDNTFQGAQANKRQFETVLSFIEAGKKGGAKVETGGERIGSKGYFVQPTVFSGVTNDMKIAKEEIFGPVAALVKFKDEAEAIKLANDTTYGLAGALHSNDANQIHRVSRKMKAGTIWVNQYVVLQNQVPFGGVRQSGSGRELGMEGLNEYLVTKSVHHYYGEPLEWPIKL